MESPDCGGAVIASVAVDRSIRRCDRLYDYIVTPGLEKTVVPGKKVAVPFGGGNGLITGTVMRVRIGKISRELKPVLSALNEYPALSAEMLSVAVYLRQSTYCTWFEAVRQLLPPGAGTPAVKLYFADDGISDFGSGDLSEDEQAVICAVRAAGVPVGDGQIKRRVKIPACFETLKKLCDRRILAVQSPVKKITEPATVKTVRLSGSPCRKRLTENQKKVIEALKKTDGATVGEIVRVAGVSAAVVENMVSRGYLKAVRLPKYRSPYVASDGGDITPAALTYEQEKAYDSLARDYNAHGFREALLFGVTGSGKTSVYLKLLDLCVSGGKTAVVTVPEIALTPQTLKLFGARYGDKIAVFHSAMPPGQRFEEWCRVKEGKATIAVGTRSAVFAPLENIGLIVIDEEQESSYKSEMAPRYRAADVARMRAKIHGAMLLLCSATPSVETYSKAVSGKCGLVTLGVRYGNARLPVVDTVDMREESARGNISSFSGVLEGEIRKALNGKKQAILLLNRRGHNTYISCPECGYVMTCDRCSISLTYHSASNGCVCHYCGKTVPPPEKCPVCGNTRMRYSGTGTQKAELELRAIFPGARVLRMDADNTATRSAFEEKISAFEAGNYDIMIGTQMVAKGLDFPNVTVVGVLNADRSLYSEDFRSFERTFSLLTQVAGRAGRGNNPGKAIIQTFDPENKIIRLAAEQDYVGFFKDEILNRKLMIYPPYCRLTVAYTVSEDRDASLSAAKFVARFIGERVREKYRSLKIIELGPVPCSVMKVNGKYRYRVIFKTGNISQTRELFAELKERFYSNGETRGTDLIIDANPDAIL